MVLLLRCVRVCRVLSNRHKHSLIKHLPNAISASRLCASFFCASHVLQEKYSSALLLLLYCGCSDVVDGYVARKFKVESKFGEIIDPIADKTLVACTTIALTINGLFPITLTALILTRDVLIILLSRRARHLAPLPISKLNTFVTIVALALTTSSPLLPNIAPLVTCSHWLCACTTIVSGVSYLRKI